MATEKPYRSLVKAISWRVTGTVDTMLISFLITK
ncbi:MAG: putative rane protein, partial [Verrucomicrobiota bacterium]